MKRRIVAVIVLYKTSADDSVSYRSLLQAAQHPSASALELAVILHDNTPGAAAPENLPPNVFFFADGKNGGLAAAYNRALSTALKGGYEWLFTLDQDTELPADALGRTLDIMDELDDRPDVAAIVPQIRAGGRIVSPNYFAGGAWPRPLPPEYTGIPEKTVYAFNSGSMIRTAALRQVGGYSLLFWLDNSDSYMYRQLSRFGKRVYVAGTIAVDHDFSMLKMQERVSPERYRTILLAESAFWDLEMNTLAGLERTARLGGRLVKHWLRGDDAALRRLTLQALRLRLLHSRQYRIARWKTATAEKLNHALNGRERPSRPMVSVCMAAYNGERHIEAQLRSILPQLEPGDEIVIVDDASQDATLTRVQQIRDVADQDLGPSLIVLQHETNQGVVRTFEDAIRKATGDILFLCDDDDLWAPDKVRKVLEAFALRPATQLVASGLTLIDEQNHPTSDSAFLRHRRFTTNLAANLLHNQFQGSAMAFRSSLIREVLPFPSNRLFLHDGWIGARNIVTKGGTTYIDEPLLLYRRHAGNYTRILSRWQQLKRRIQLVAALLGRAFHKA